MQRRKPVHCTTRKGRFTNPNHALLPQALFSLLLHDIPLTSPSSCLNKELAPSCLPITDQSVTLASPGFSTRASNRANCTLPISAKFGDVNYISAFFAETSILGLSLLLPVTKAHSVPYCDMQEKGVVGGEGCVSMNRRVGPAAFGDGATSAASARRNTGRERRAGSSSYMTHIMRTLSA